MPVVAFAIRQPQSARARALSGLFLALVCASSSCGGGAKPNETRDPLPLCNPVRELLAGGDFEAPSLSAFDAAAGQAALVRAPRRCPDAPAQAPRRGAQSLSTAAADGARADDGVALLQTRPLPELGLSPGALVAASVFVAGTCDGAPGATSTLALRFLRAGEVLDGVSAEPLVATAGAWRQQTTPTAQVPAEADAVQVELRATAGAQTGAIDLLADDLSLAECRPLGEQLAAWKTPFAAEPLGQAAPARGDAPRPPVAIPPSMLGGDTTVSCTVECGEPGCAAATVYVSACDSDSPDQCHGITPIDSADAQGNTYLVSLTADGRARLVPGATCAASQESKEGLALDLVFVIDTTGSMASAIQGVVESIDSLVNTLADRGVDTRIGGIAFGDQAPLRTCRAPDAPFAPLTGTYGAGTRADPASFNYWLANLSASHCGDQGGDGPENALDALEFVLGRAPSDGADKRAFSFRPGALKVAVVITDVSQHQKGDGSPIAHFALEEAVRDLTGVAVVHTVGPNFSCMQTPFAGCLCDRDAKVCDVGCECDARCPTPGCPADVKIGACDHPMQTCDLDCPGYPARNFCDKRPGVCDPHPLRADTPCADDFDCLRGARVGEVRPRRCFREDLGAFVDVAALSVATGGAFTPLPAGGHVDLTRLPLSGVITATERCQAALPSDAQRLRCVYQDAQGHRGEVTVSVDRR